MKNMSKVRNFSVLIAVSLLTLFLLFMPINQPLYNLLMFPFPDPRTPDISADLQKMRSFNLDAREVIFPSKNGNQLHGIYLKAPNTRRVFLFSHGKGNNIYTQLTKARCFSACGASVLMYDYQGFGKSQGRPSIEGACEDGLAAYDYLVTQLKYDPKDIVALGQSFGTGVTGQLALQRELAGVVMLSGFSSLISAGRDSFIWLRLYPDFCFPKQMLDNAAVFSKVHVPLLIVHGTADRVISWHEATRLYEKASQPKSILVMEGEGHASFGKDNTFALTLKEFLERNKI